MQDYWKKQDVKNPLFPDTLWSKPERRDLAGKLVIIGGNSQSFASVAAAHQTAFSTGVGAVRIVLPDALKKTLPVAFSSVVDLLFAPTNPSGGFAAAALPDWQAAADWADTVLFIGDSGANSETAALLETFLTRNTDTSVIITRDAIDLVQHSAEIILGRASTSLVVSFSQLQRLFRAVYYPRVLTFNQGIKQIAETLHKFTITYPDTITLWHANNLFVAKDGQVITQEFTTPLRVWNGEVATRAAVWQIWQTDPIKAIATSWTEL